MDNRSEVRQFLATRRAKITPEQAGLPFYGGNRRVPGLRREEVAMMAGVSADYYTRLEKGNLAGVSDSRTRSCGRLGPATLGSTVARSSERVWVYSASGELAVWKRPCAL